MFFPLDSLYHCSTLLEGFKNVFSTIGSSTVFNKEEFLSHLGNKAIPAGLEAFSKSTIKKDLILEFTSSMFFAHIFSVMKNCSKFNLEFSS